VGKRAPPRFGVARAVSRRIAPPPPSPDPRPPVGGKTIIGRQSADRRRRRWRPRRPRARRAWCARRSNGLDPPPFSLSPDPTVYSLSASVNSTWRPVTMILAVPEAAAKRGGKATRVGAAAGVGRETMGRAIAGRGSAAEGRARRMVRQRVGKARAAPAPATRLAAAPRGRSRAALALPQDRLPAPMPRASHLATAGGALFVAAAAQMIQREREREERGGGGGKGGRARRRRRPLPRPLSISSDRDALKLSHAPAGSSPLIIMLQVIVASLLCGWGAALGAGTLRHISPAANQHPCDRAPLRPDFVAANTRALAMPLRLDPF